LVMKSSSGAAGTRPPRGKIRFGVAIGAGLGRAGLDRLEVDPLG